MTPGFADTNNYRSADLFNSSPIELAQVLQRDIDFAHSSEEADVLGALAAEELRSMHEVYGGRHLIISALTAYIVNRDIVHVDRELHMQAPASLSGYFAGVKYYTRDRPPVIHSLVVDLFDVQFVRSSDFPDPPQRKFREPFIIPVGSVTSVFPKS